MCELLLWWWWCRCSGCCPTCSHEQSGFRWTSLLAVASHGNAAECAATDTQIFRCPASTCDQFRRRSRHLTARLEQHSRDGAQALHARAARPVVSTQAHGRPRLLLSLRARRLRTSSCSCSWPRARAASPGGAGSPAATTAAPRSSCAHAPRDGQCSTGRPPRRKVAVPIPGDASYSWEEFLAHVRQKLKIAGVRDVRLASVSRRP